ncbi:LAMI_0F09296g1_1 [Lachancea mirantina]|uniref:Methionine--tRNA ligase, mitochondrial n=1 Tax=Lachancea mirantina TaxID=1230905 RepID=A0A1G4K145_9SACH|nr:LAMI_0F09296g1_1 [Lachancea mirantina]
MRSYRRFSSSLSRAVHHVTTPIFYPNAKPHLGHLYSSLLCDASRRWQKMVGFQTLMTTGTDEHGLKIQTASEAQNFASPKQFVDVLYKEFIKLDQNADIEYSRFIRTTDQDHIDNVQKLWKLCEDRGYIYKGEHAGWYSISDESFYPTSKVVKVALDGTKSPLEPGQTSGNCKFINTETNNEVIYQSEINYFFKLSAVYDQLVHFLVEERPDFISPQSRRSEILKELLSSPLSDLSISRPASRIRWGIDVPQDSSQKIYVWFDALCNYLTSLGGIDAIRDNTLVELKHTGLSSTDCPAKWWENTTHVVGKDISRFHVIYWPSFLIAAGLKLPKKVMVHGHWLSGGVKMSKSLGNVVDPQVMLSHYGSDILRLFLLENSHLSSDCDFSEERLHNTSEKLASKWGNLISRCCGSKFSLERASRTFASKPFDKFERIISDAEARKAYGMVINGLLKLKGEYSKRMTNFDYRGAILLVWDLIDKANNFLQIAKPWTKTGEEQDLIIFTAIEAARISAVLCHPIIPGLSAKFLNRIDVEPEKRTIAFASFGSDSTYGCKSNTRGRELPFARIPRRPDL